MKRGSFALFALIVCLTLNAGANEKWQTQKTAGALSVCYQALAEMYCAGSVDKKTAEIDLKHYLSVFLYFSSYEVNRNDLVLQPGITRLIKGARPESGKKVIQGAYDYLLREGKRKGVMLSKGKGKETQVVFTETDQINEVEAVNWPKYIDSSIDTIVCTKEGMVGLTFKVTNSMKKDFVFNGDEVELRIVSGRYEILSAGSVKESRIVLKVGETKSFSIDIPITGDMVPSMRYKIVPFIKNIEVSKEEASVLCEESR
jgi:hypothetical protein